MSKIIEIENPQVICGRLLERIVAMERLQDLTDTDVYRECMKIYVEKLKALGFELQTSINETVKRRHGNEY